MSETTPTTPAAEEEFTPIDMIYIGHRLGADNNKLLAFCVIGATNRHEEAVFDATKARKQFSHGVIGGVYRNSQNAAGKSFRLSKSYVRFSDDPRIPEWKLADDAVEIELRMLKTMEADRKIANQSIEDLLEPLRQRYAKTDRLGRMAIEVRVLAALRKGVLF